jgi:hypothetical protein
MAVLPELQGSPIAKVAKTKGNQLPRQNECHPQPAKRVEIERGDDHS